VSQAFSPEDAWFVKTLYSPELFFTKNILESELYPGNQTRMSLYFLAFVTCFNGGLPGR